MRRIELMIDQSDWHFVSIFTNTISNNFRKTEVALDRNWDLHFYQYLRQFIIQQYAQYVIKSVLMSPGIQFGMHFKHFFQHVF